MSRTLKRILLSGLVLATLVGASVSYVAIKHNPNDEFVDSGGHLVWSTLALIFGSWWLITFCVVLLATSPWLVLNRQKR